MKHGKTMNLIILLSAFFMLQCTSNSEVNNDEPLPIIPRINQVSGELEKHTIRQFSFINQDSQIVTNETFKDKIYVSDFFFIHCPTICPKVKANMKFMYDELKGNDEVIFISHSIDTRYDTVPALKAYAEKLEIDTERWHLVTGDKKAIYEIAADYVSSAKEDAGAPGGFDHSGYLVLIDKKGHVRSFARGTEREEAEKLLRDIGKLLKES